MLTKISFAGALLTLLFCSDQFGDLSKHAGGFLAEEIGPLAQTANKLLAFFTLRQLGDLSFQVFALYVDW